MERSQPNRDLSATASENSEESTGSRSNESRSGSIELWRNQSLDEDFGPFGGHPEPGYIAEPGSNPREIADVQAEVMRRSFDDGVEYLHENGQSIREETGLISTRVGRNGQVLTGNLPEFTDKLEYHYRDENGNHQVYRGEMPGIMAEVALRENFGLPINEATDLRNYVSEVRFMYPGRNGSRSLSGPGLGTNYLIAPYINVTNRHVLHQASGMAFDPSDPIAAIRTIDNSRMPVMLRLNNGRNDYIPANRGIGHIIDHPKYDMLIFSSPLRSRNRLGAGDSIPAFSPLRSLPSDEGELFLHNRPGGSLYRGQPTEVRGRKKPHEIITITEAAYRAANYTDRQIFTTNWGAVPGLSGTPAFARIGDRLHYRGTAGTALYTDEKAARDLLPSPETAFYSSAVTVDLLEGISRHYRSN